MPPPQPQSTNPQQSPTNQFEFILKDKPKAPKSFNLLSKFSKPVKILIIFGLVLIAVVFAASFASRGSGAAKANLVGLMGRSQEITRVSKLAEERLKDPQVKSLATTAQLTLSSTQSQISAYMKKNKIKFSAKELSPYVNKKSDQLIQGGVQNNNLEEVYINYLSQNIKDYQAALQKAAKTTKSKTQQKIFQEAFDSNKVILSSNAIEQPGS